MSRQCSEVLAQVDVEIRSLLRSIASEEPRPRRLLDVGCWDGSTTRGYADLLGGEALGIEVFEEPARRAEARGVQVSRLNLESENFPWPDESVDVVVANQVFEHLKNVWLPMSEAVRVLRVGGYLVLSVPNLASLHNRLMLALGFQPSSIRTFGPHVRGYTQREIRNFVAHDGILEVRTVRGAGLYPLPAGLVAPLARVWPDASHTVIVLARKRKPTVGRPWVEYLERELDSGLQTFYE